MRRLLEKLEFVLISSIVGGLAILGIPALAADGPRDDPMVKHIPTAVDEVKNDGTSPIPGEDSDLSSTLILPVQAEESAATTQGGPKGFGVKRTATSAERRSRDRGPSTDVISGAEAQVRPSGDLGSLLGQSQDASGLIAQKRTPIVTDTRLRGTKTGQLQASGSYWMPARLDLDTLVSKLDSSVVGDVIVIKGPYSVQYGPGFSFFDISLAGSPRYTDGTEWHGRTSLNFQTNGEQWYGRQTILGGSNDWGLRVGYGHRTGNDYDSGDGSDLPTSYNSRDFDVALGFDLSPDEHIEFSYLRLDQTGVEFPGQIFDVRFLVTDAYELKYTLDNQCYFDHLSLDTWYNRTRFDGNAQGSGKRQQIPQLTDPIGFVGFTNVDAMSTGYRLAASWGDQDCGLFTIGTDLIYFKQELNEFDAFFGRPSQNFPIPRSYSADAGLFIEQLLPVCDRLTIKAGARVDWVSTDIDGTPPGLTQAELHEQLATDDFDKEFNLWSAYVNADYRVNEHCTALAGFGTAQRPPTLTELYAVQPFLAILQQGFSSVRGDPELNAERIWQIDLGFTTNYDRFRGGIHGFYAWVQDYTTYEAITQVLEQPDGLLVQFVNTDLATLAGGEIHGEYDWNPWMTPFATLAFVEGRDHTRDSRGEVIRDSNGNPIPGVGALGSKEEPLPGIAPLESRLGVRFHEPSATPHWGIELAARVVGEQDRVASSLQEQQTAGFTVWDLRSFWRATDSLLLVSGVENFTDKNYHEHLDLRTGKGVLQPGVSFYFGLELSY